MSYCALILFRDGKVSESITYNNSWGGAAYIWQVLYDKHCKTHKFDNWMNNPDCLWKLASNENVASYERSTLAFTFDKFLVKRENFPRLADDLRFFAKIHIPETGAFHLPAWADAIENFPPDVNAVALYATSVSENLWNRYDEETDSMIAYDLSMGEHEEVYQWMQ